MFRNAPPLFASEVRLPLMVCRVSNGVAQRSGIDERDALGEAALAEIVGGHVGLGGIGADRPAVGEAPRTPRACRPSRRRDSGRPRAAVSMPVPAGVPVERGMAGRHLVVVVAEAERAVEVALRHVVELEPEPPVLLDRLPQHLAADAGERALEEPDRRAGIGVAVQLEQVVAGQPDQLRLPAGIVARRVAAHRRQVAGGLSAPGSSNTPRIGWRIMVVNERPGETADAAAELRRSAAAGTRRCRRRAARSAPG